MKHAFHKLLGIGIPKLEVYKILLGHRRKLKLHRDLTPYVKLATSELIEYRLRSLKTIIKFIPFTWLRLYLKTHRGGYALQKLYREGIMGYHLIVAGKSSKRQP